MSNNEIVSEALSLPLADRFYSVNQLLESFNPIQSQLDNT